MVPREMSKGDQKREQIYAFLLAFFAQEQRAPTLFEIWKGCGLSSKSHAVYHLNILERQGRIARPAHLHCAIRVVRIIR